jgi:hypothetical protein
VRGEAFEVGDVEFEDDVEDHDSEAEHIRLF